MNYLSIKQIQDWLNFHRKRLSFGDAVPTFSEIADRAGISRQTLYAVLRSERSEFGEVAQIRLSRVIQQITAEPAFKSSRVARVDLNSAIPTIKFGF